MNVTLLVSHEPFIGKFLNIFARDNVFKLSRQVQGRCRDLILILYIDERSTPGKNIEEWPDMAHD